MRSAILSKSARVRKAAIDALPGPVLLVHPKKLPRTVQHGIAVSYEDITKDAQWLRVNAVIGDSWALALECPSRYPTITSLKVQFLQRLANRMRRVHIIDIVPFTLGIEYLYTPYSYLGRDILGFPHWYAFREGYGELINGRVVDSLSPEALAPKIAPYTQCDYKWFTARDISSVTAPATPRECAQYATLRTHAFAKHTTPRPVITALADFSHACESRTTAVLDLARPGDAVFCNLQSYAARLNRRLPKGARAYSYAKPPERAERVIIAEPSISNDYQQFDAEALSERVVWVRSDLPVDRYLHGRQDAVRAQINALVQRL